MYEIQMDIYHDFCFKCFFLLQLSLSNIINQIYKKILNSGSRLESGAIISVIALICFTYMAVLLVEKLYGNMEEVFFTFS